MKTTVKHVGSVTWWEGLEANSISHRELIEHWVNGGELENADADGKWYPMKTDDPVFLPEWKYRIKQRKPLPGEVWVSHLNKFYMVSSENSYIYLKDGKLCGIVDSYKTMKYSAPSVEAYYARKFKKECDDNTDLELEAYSVIEKACDLGGD